MGQISVEITAQNESLLSGNQQVSIFENTGALVGLRKGANFGADSQKAGIAQWMMFYNHQRPHAAHRGLPPAGILFNPTANTESSLIYPRNCPANGE